MRTAFSPEEFELAFLTAQKESQIAFGDGTMYIEHFVEHPRHIEFQILADSQGNVVHLGERDCSIQRNHQKMIEESPSMAVSEELRNQMGMAAVKAAKAAHYVNAGTIEFLLELLLLIYFLQLYEKVHQNLHQFGWWQCGHGAPHHRHDPPVQDTDLYDRYGPSVQRWRTSADGRP